MISTESIGLILKRALSFIFFSIIATSTSNHVVKQKSCRTPHLPPKPAQWIFASSFGNKGACDRLDNLIYVYADYQKKYINNKTIFIFILFFPSLLNRQANVF